MSGSPEKRRDCIAQLALRSPIFSLALNYVTTLIRLRQRLRNWGCAPCRASPRAAKLQAPTPRGKEKTSFQTRNTETLERSFRKETERRLSLADRLNRLLARVRVCVVCPCVLLLFYFRPSDGGPSERTAIVPKKLILPMKIVNRLLTTSDQIKSALSEF